MQTTTGLILSGGGARAAYQVGVLEELATLRRAANVHSGNPFPVVCGTSAGAINAAALACQADHFDTAVERLSNIWRGFHAEQVYRSDTLDMVVSGARWLTLIAVGWLVRQKRWRPKSLLNNDPLAELLKRNVPLDRLPALLADGHLRALAISAFSYSQGQHVTFYQSQHETDPWIRNQRKSVPTTLQYEHLLASSGIPFIFPAVCLEGPEGPAFYGDGSMRQTAPISPAIHLGADKILVIGAGRMQEPKKAEPVAPTYPSLAQIAGHSLSSIFLDALAVDVERLQRINHTLELIPEVHRQSTRLKPVEFLLIAPSQRLDDIATRYARDLPPTVKRLMKLLGASPDQGNVQNGTLISYLLFEGSYTRELMALGRADTQAKASEIKQFMGWE